jgi:hypothetical protein
MGSSIHAATTKTTRRRLEVDNFVGFAPLAPDAVAIEGASDSGPRPHARYGQNDRAIAISRKNYLFAGSDAGGGRAAAIYSLIEDAKLTVFTATLPGVFTRIADRRPAHCRTSALVLATREPRARRCLTSPLRRAF